jgi:hypothetical protein
LSSPGDGANAWLKRVEALEMVRTMKTEMEAMTVMRFKVVESKKTPDIPKKLKITMNMMKMR